MLKFDYHTHTNHSHDSKTSMKTMIEQAIYIGLEEIAITDHIDFSFPDNAVISPWGIDANVKAIKSMQEKYADKIAIRVGTELNLRPDSAEACHNIAESNDFDIIIGSVHELNNSTDFGHPELYQNHTKHKAYTIYFETVLEALKACDSYDVLGHLDYVERYGIYQDNRLIYAEYRDIVDEILRHVVHNGKGIEINTSGLAYGLWRPHPQADIIYRYLQLGGEIITIGSDAHSPDRIGYGFDEAHRMLQDIGVKHICQFINRQPKFVRI